MNTINGKPIGDIVSCGAKTGSYLPSCGKDTVSMTFRELETQWRRVKPDGKSNGKK